MPKLVVHGATLACSMGSSPSSLSVLPTNETYGGTAPAATVQDMKPELNLAPFGRRSCPLQRRVGVYHKVGVRMRHGLAVTASFLTAVTVGCSRPTLAPEDPEAGVSAEAATTRAERAACAGRPGCAATDMVEAGKDGRNRELVVVIVPHEAGEPHGLQSWLIAVPPGGEAERVRLLAQCSDCSAGVEVARRGHVRFVERSLALPTPVTTYILGLDPPSVLSVSEGGPVPAVDAAELGAFEPDGWRSTGLGDCASLLEAAPGASPAANPATVRVLATRSALYLEVEDASFSATGARTDRLDMGFCWGDGKPTSCQDWSQRMDGALLITGPPRPSASGQWSWKTVERRGELSIVSPTVRRFRVSGPSAYGGFEAKFVYEKAGDGGEPRDVVDVFRDVQLSTPSVRCIDEGGTLRRVHATAGGSGEALIP